MPFINQLTLMACHCRFGWHSLVAAYGVPQEKLTFIPHGIVLPESPKPSTSRRHLLESITLGMALKGASVAREAAQGEGPVAYFCRLCGTVVPAGVCRPDSELPRLSLRALCKQRRHILSAEV